MEIVGWLMVFFISPLLTVCFFVGQLVIPSSCVVVLGVRHLEAIEPRSIRVFRDRAAGPGWGFYRALLLRGGTATPFCSCWVGGVAGE